MNNVYKADCVGSKLAFSMVLCEKDWSVFKSGLIYPVVGWNNGNQIVGCDKYGATVYALGIHKGDCISVFDYDTGEELEIFKVIYPENWKGDMQ